MTIQQSIEQKMNKHCIYYGSQAIFQMTGACSLLIGRSERWGACALLQTGRSRIVARLLRDTRAAEGYRSYRVSLTEIFKKRLYVAERRDYCR